jgi:hypothetical protein
MCKGPLCRTSKHSIMNFVVLQHSNIIDADVIWLTNTRTEENTKGLQKGFVGSSGPFLVLTTSIIFSRTVSMGRAPAPRRPAGPIVSRVCWRLESPRGGQRCQTTHRDSDGCCSSERQAKPSRQSMVSQTFASLDPTQASRTFAAGRILQLPGCDTMLLSMGLHVAVRAGTARSGFRPAAGQRMSAAWAATPTPRTCWRLEQQILLKAGEVPRRVSWCGWPRTVPRALSAEGGTRSRGSLPW